MNTLPLHENPARTTPRGLIRYASEFYAAAEAADEVLGAKPGYEMFAPVPVMFMMGQSIELSLKSYLLASNVPLPTLKSRKFGHRLMACLEEANRLGLGQIVTLDGDDTSVIATTDVLYSSKQLQYMVIGAKTFPIYGPLESATRKLLEAVAVHVNYPPHRLPHAL